MMCTITTECAVANSPLLYDQLSNMENRRSASKCSPLVLDAQMFC